MTYVRLAVFLSVVLAHCGLSYAQSNDDIMSKINALRWTDGPTTVSTVGNATVFLPKDYGFLDADETRKFSILLENPPGTDITHTIVPNTLSWQAYLTYDGMGYVKDDEIIDADAILDSIRRGTEDSNKERIKNGWEPMEIVGWRYKPHYDKRTNRLVWAIEGRTGDGLVINYNEKILGRRGVTTALLVASPDRLDVAVKEFESIIDGYQFSSGDTYAEFRAGDHVAEFGLGALILGGGAAAIAKSGAAKGLFTAVSGGLESGFPCQLASVKVASDSTSGGIGNGKCIFDRLA